MFSLILELYSALDQLTCPVDSRLLYSLLERVSILYFPTVIYALCWFLQGHLCTQFNKKYIFKNNSLLGKS
jgi:hypothetical protein